MEIIVAPIQKEDYSYAFHSTAELTRDEVIKEICRGILKGELSTDIIHLKLSTWTIGRLMEDGIKREHPRLRYLSLIGSIKGENDNITVIMEGEQLAE